MQAVVAALAVVLLVILAEVVEQQLPAAGTGLGVGHHLVEQLAAYLLLGHGLALHEFLQSLDVLVAVVGDAVALLPVTARTAGLLVVALDALRDVVVDHEAHVGLVYAHSEGYGGNYHLDVLHQEGILVVGTHLGLQSGMVRQGLYTIELQQVGYLLNLLAAETVDDSGLAGILLDVADDVLLRLHLVTDLVVEVGPVEGGFEDLRAGDAEVLQDVALDLRGSRGGQGDDGRTAYGLHQGADAAVLRTEIVSPLGDAVGLVHGVEGYLHAPQKVHVLVLGEGLRRHVEDLGLAGQQVGADLLHLHPVERRIEEMCHAAGARVEAPEKVHLVLHQRDERGDDYGSPLHHERRELVAQRLATSRGHQYEGVTSSDQMHDDIFLIGLERVVAEEFLQRIPYLCLVGSHSKSV